MVPLATRLAIRFGRWPRRIAALICLLLAAVTALDPVDAAHGAAQPADVLLSGQVATPLPVDPASIAPGLRAGARVGVVYQAAQGEPGDAHLLADHLRVLSVGSPESGLTGTDSIMVVVACDRTTAVRISRFTSDQLHLLDDSYP